MNIKVSVALTTYNGSRFIIDQLNSICNQTIVPDEIIICDDCSNDNTTDIIKDFAVRTQVKIDLFINTENLGPRRNFEKCSRLCSGDIVLFCDQDDVWSENKVERIINEFDNVDVVFVFSDGYVTDGNLNIVKNSEWTVDWSKYNTQEFFDYCQTRNFPLGHLQAIRRSVLVKMYPFLSDPDGWIAQCAPAFGKVRAIPEKLVLYRRHLDAVSDAFIDSRKQSILRLIKKMWKINYQEYFTWPEAELTTYSRLFELVSDNGFKVNPDRLIEHIEYLKKLTEAESGNYFERKKALRILYESGIYQQYRGNKNTYIFDQIFMLINSIMRCD